MKKVDFLIEYEVRPRELDSMCLVAAYLRSKGYTVAFVNSWESLYQRPEPYEAEVAVISACYNDGTYDAFTGLAYSMKKVVNMQWEQVLANPYYEPHPYDFVDYTGVALETRHLCWGKKEKEWLENLHKIPSRFLSVLGYLPLDFYRPELKKLLIPREQLFDKYNLDINKQTFLFISSFAAVGLPDSEKFGDLSLQDNIEEISLISQSTVLKWFQMYLKEHPEVQLIYRAHPAEKDNEYIKSLSEQNKNFFVVSEEAVRHWIVACDCILNWNSTSSIEVYFSRKDMHILRPVPVPYDMDMCIFQDAKFIDCYENFEMAVSTKLPFPIPEENLLQWYDMQEEPVYKRIGDWLIETHNSDDYCSRASRYNVHKHLWYKRLKYWLKQSAAFNVISSWMIKNMGDNKIAAKLSSVSKGIKKERERLDPNGYMAEKRKQNSASPQEIEQKIEEYLKIIKENA